MEDVLCFSVDAESDWGAPIAQSFGVTGYPTMIFLNSDGTLRDQIVGYMPPEPFIGEVTRISSNVGTVASLRATVEANPKDIDARYKLATKLRDLGDKAGFDEQVAAIKGLDPEGTSGAMQRITIDSLAASLDREHLDASAIVAFLENATDDEALFQGHGILARIYGIQVQTADADTAGMLRGKAIASYRVAWAHCNESDLASFGNSVAWNLWEMRTELSDADKAFALELAQKAASLSSEDPSVLDTLACCQFMNGKAEEALATIDRAIALDPENKEWRDRRTLFTTQG